MNSIDRLIQKMENGKHAPPSQQESVRIILANIITMIPPDKDKYTLVITGSVKAEKLREVCEYIKLAIKEYGDNQLNTEIDVVCSGDIRYNADTVRLAQKSDGVVLVEQMGKSSYIDIDRQIETFKDLKKEPLGFILI